MPSHWTAGTSMLVVLALVPGRSCKVYLYSLDAGVRYWMLTHEHLTSSTFLDSSPESTGWFLKQLISNRREMNKSRHDM